MLGEIFDPKADLAISEHFRPHWSQSGAITFLTFRTHDSIPREVLDRWEREKQHWIHLRGFLGHWSEVIPRLANADRAEFNNCFNRCREEFLDTCQGACVLARPEVATIVADSLLFFDGERYRMGDFIVMPNHVHLLCVFPTPDAMVRQCDSWLHYTARQINRLLDTHGKFWQQEPFDHLVRSPEQYEYFRRYIVENPKNAGISEGQFLYRRYEH